MSLWIAEVFKKKQQKQTKTPKQTHNNNQKNPKPTKPTKVPVLQPLFPMHALIKTKPFQENIRLVGSLLHIITPCTTN